MKDIHAKGWHTQQQYYKDNNPRAAEKNTVLASSPISDDGYKGWKEYRFVDGVFVVRYPAEKVNSEEPKCISKEAMVLCYFDTADVKLMMTSAAGVASQESAFSEYIENQRRS